MASWQILEDKELYVADPWLRLSRQVVKLPDGRLIRDYHSIQMPDYSVVVAITHDGKILLHKQYKHGVGRVNLVLPGGMVNAHEEPLVGAKRELLEETGLTASEWRYYGSYVESGNYGCGKAHIYLAKGLSEIAEPNSQDLEESETVYLEPKDVMQAIREGQIGTLGALAALLSVLNDNL